MTLYEAGSNTLKKSLINGNIDIALLGSLNQDDDDRLKTFQLASTPFYVFLSSKHPLANKKGIVTIPLLDNVQPIFNINIAFRKNHVLTVEEEMLVSVLSQKDNNHQYPIIGYNK